MVKSELFQSKLSDAGWIYPDQPAVYHEQTRDYNVVKDAVSYMLHSPNSSFQTSLAIFNDTDFLRMRLHDLASNDFNWLQIEYGNELGGLLDEIVAMQNNLPSKSYISLSFGAFSSQYTTSILAWEQF